MRACLIVAAIMILSGCASQNMVSDKAAKIQVFSQMSTLVDKCVRIGPINVSLNQLDAAQSVVEATKILARERASDMGGDTMVITNIDHSFSGLYNKITVQAVALKCY